MFLCFCQLALAPLLGPYPQAYTASQLRSLRRAPGRLDHRPVHIFQRARARPIGNFRSTSKRRTSSRAAQRTPSRARSGLMFRFGSSWQQPYLDRVSTDLRTGFTIPTQHTPHNRSAGRAQRATLGRATQVFWFHSVATSGLAWVRKPTKSSALDRTSSLCRIFRRSLLRRRLNVTREKAGSSIEGTLLKQPLNYIEAPSKKASSKKTTQKNG